MTSTNNFWKVFTPQQNDGCYQDIYEKIAVVVYPSGGCALTKVALERIGSPRFLHAVSSGHLFGFLPSESKAGAYTVTHGHKTKMPRVSCGKFLESIGAITPGFKKIYIGTLFNGAITFDTSKSPYRIEEHKIVSNKKP